MMTETFNIITNADPAVVPYSSLLANIITVLWGGLSYGICRIVASLFREHQPVPRITQLITFSLLMALASCGPLSLLFLPFTWETLLFFPFSLEIPLPLPGILITFVLFAVLISLSIRKKECSFWLKLALMVLTVVLPLLAGCLAVSNSLVFTSGWEIFWRQLHLFVFLFLGYSICSLIISIAAIKQENRELMRKNRELMEQIRQQQEQCRKKMKKFSK